MASPKKTEKKSCESSSVWHEEGKISNQEQFKKIEGEDFFEFKHFQIRMPCYFQATGRLIITHGFMKKEAGIRPEEIARMNRIRDEYEQRT